MKAKIEDIPTSYFKTEDIPVECEISGCTEMPETVIQLQNSDIFYLCHDHRINYLRFCRTGETNAKKTT